MILNGFIVSWYFLFDSVQVFAGHLDTFSLLSGIEQIIVMFLIYISNCRSVKFLYLNTVLYCTRSDKNVLCSKLYAVITSTYAVTAFLCDSQFDKM